MAANKFIVSLFIVVIAVVATQAHYGKPKPCKQCLISPCHASQPNQCGPRERCVPLPCCNKKCVPIASNPCARVKCKSGRKCIVRNKKAVCKPSCKTKTCAINEECVIKKKQAVCQPNRFVGRFENHNYDKKGKNNWHYVTIAKHENSYYVWKNAAGVQWKLYPYNKDTLRVGPDCPYFKSGHKYAKFSNGGVYGPWNEFYQHETCDDKMDKCSKIVCSDVVKKSKCATTCQLCVKPNPCDINPCACAKCSVGFICAVVNGKADCVASCKTKICAVNEECVIKNNQAVCQPKCNPAGCTATLCPAGTICKFDGCTPKCVKPNPCDINPCACAKCSAGFICVVVNGKPDCVASCKTKTCAVNEECVIKNNQAVCQPRCNLAGCTAALCPKGTICKFDGCNPKCEPIEAPCDPCKYTKCPSNKTCERSTCDKCAAKCVKKSCPVCKADPCTPGIHKCKSNEKCIPVPCSCQNTCKPNPPTSTCKKDGTSDGKICTQAFQVFCNKSCSSCCTNNNGCAPSKEFSKTQADCKFRGK